MAEIALQRGLSAAANFLARNNELRSALNIAPDVELKPCPLGLGEHNLNYKFADPDSGTQYVLRINVVPQPFHKDQIAYEATALDLLAPSHRTPLVYYVDSSRRWMDDCAMVISFCAGDMLDFDNLCPGDLARSAQIMADVHSVDITGAYDKYYKGTSPSKYGATIYHPQDPLQLMYDEAVARFDAYKASDCEDRRITAWCNRLFDAVKKIMLQTPPPTGSPSLINTETLPSHFLISHPQDAESDNISHAAFVQTHAHPGYLIDWERPIIGEAAQDVAYFVSPTSTFWDSNYLFPASDVKNFLNAYIDAVDGRIDLGNFYERFSAYRAMTVLRSTSWCCRALANYAKDSKAHKVTKTADKLSIYLSDDFLEKLMQECFIDV